MLGSNGGFSYLVGFGASFPQQPHHRGASCNGPTGPCGYDQYNRDIPNPHVLTGAMVGGPDQNDAYSDSRSNYVQAEPTLDAITSLLTPLASLV